MRQIADARIVSNPQDAQGHFWLAKVIAGFNDFDGALAHAEKAVALGGDNAAYHGQLAEVCALIADRSTPVKGFAYVRRMRKEIDAALALNPNHIDTLLVDMMFSSRHRQSLAATGRRHCSSRIVFSLFLRNGVIWHTHVCCRTVPMIGQRSSNCSELQMLLRRFIVPALRWHCSIAALRNRNGPSWQRRQHFRRSLWTQMPFRHIRCSLESTHNRSDGPIWTS